MLTRLELLFIWFRRLISAVVTSLFLSPVLEGFTISTLWWILLSEYFSSKPVLVGLDLAVIIILSIFFCYDGKIDFGDKPTGED